MLFYFWNAVPMVHQESTVKLNDVACEMLKVAAVQLLELSPYKSVALEERKPFKSIIDRRSLERPL